MKDARRPASRRFRLTDDVTGIAALFTQISGFSKATTDLGDLTDSGRDVTMRLPPAAGNAGSGSVGMAGARVAAECVSRLHCQP